MNKISVNGEIAVILKDITYSYYSDGAKIQILKGLSLSIFRGETCAVVGSSGSGKSTLLNLIGLLDKPESGCLFIDGLAMEKMSRNELALARNSKIGFIFQGFNLLPKMTATENVALPLIYRGESKTAAHTKARKYLDMVGLGDKFDRFPADLSGGQKQRVAIARSIVGGPTLLLADEPTGSLDKESGEDIFNLLISLNKAEKVTVIMVTHDQYFASRLKRTISIDDGRIRSDSYSDELRKEDVTFI